jgi:hypothetical protein
MTYCMLLGVLRLNIIKLNCTDQLLFYVDYVCIFGGKFTYCKEKHRVLLIFSKETGEKLTVIQKQYVVIYRDQDRGRN